MQTLQSVIENKFIIIYILVFKPRKTCVDNPIAILPSYYQVFTNTQLLYALKNVVVKKDVQAALVIRGFDYSRAGKWRKTANTEAVL